MTNKLAPERRFGLKRLRARTSENGSQVLVGLFQRQFSSYPLPSAEGHPGKWTEPRKVQLCHSGWHFYHTTKHARIDQGFANRHRWFLIEAEGPFVSDAWKTAARRLRFICDVTPENGEDGYPAPLPPIGVLVRRARKAGLL